MSKREERELALANFARAVIKEAKYAAKAARDDVEYNSIGGNGVNCCEAENVLAPLAKLAREALKA